MKIYSIILVKFDTIRKRREELIICSSKNYHEITTNASMLIDTLGKIGLLNDFVVCRTKTHFNIILYLKSTERNVYDNNSK